MQFKRTPSSSDDLRSVPDCLQTESQGCFLNIEDANETKERLSGWGAPEDVDYIVVTDGEEILGIGDQGSQGVGISTAKLCIRTPLSC